ncbi:MAG: hypothetical protein HY898_17830 [Deltaproteobacteria bacterium]|nr:hypothetical protein [Deltaproteobacteria bacterium]
MARTIFYSWQSDLAGRMNKNLIRKALDEAAAACSGDASVEEAVRVDQDTQGVPGSPPIAETILQKIEACDVFVADLTFVAHRAGGGGVPNPNVLIEYGYAMKASGHSRIVAVFNKAHGDARDLPFDLSHRRFPIVYNIDDDAPDTERQNARKDLASRLTSALRPILKENAKASSLWEPTAPRDGAASFFAPDEVVTIDREHRAVPTELRLPRSARSFVRVIPSAPMAPMSEVRLLEIARNHIRPAHPRGLQGWNSSRNIHGAVVYAFDRDEKFIRSLTQLFISGEIWGIDTYGVSAEYHSERGSPYIPTVALERDLQDTLSNYLQAAQLLELRAPFRVVLGVSGVEGHRLAVPANLYPEGEFMGDIYRDEIVLEASMPAPNSDVNAVVPTFIARVYDAAGLVMPARR